ncbi:hypothetical protein MTBSS4_250076 [Magnetospirillum sp. SS-4]|nr:hypothetical protein MTBSS4_250076 [Magnetospirillum sp. SS-4]
MENWFLPGTFRYAGGISARFR